MKGVVERLFGLKISQKCIYLQELLLDIKWMLFLKLRFFLWQ
jgi:hypothetical protein